MNTAQKRKTLTQAYALATELLEIAKESAAAAAEAVAKFESQGQPDEEEDFLAVLLGEKTAPGNEEEAWARAVLASATEALQAAEARLAAADKALTEYTKAARERRWKGLVKSGGAEAWRQNYNTDGRTW